MLIILAIFSVFSPNKHVKCTPLLLLFIHYSFILCLSTVTPRPGPTQRSPVTAAVVSRGFWIPTTVTRAPGSVRVWWATPVCSARTARRSTSPTAPAAACPAPATPSVRWTPSVTGEAAFSHSPSRAASGRKVGLFVVSTQLQRHDSFLFCFSLLKSDQLCSYIYCFSAQLWYKLLTSTVSNNCMWCKRGGRLNQTAF